MSIASVALSAGFELRCFIDKNKAGQTLLGVRIVGDLSEIDDLCACSFAIAIGDNAIRERIHTELVNSHCNLNFPPLIHRSSTISAFSDIGEGTVVMPGAVVGPNSQIGKFCIINTQASIDHDSSMLDFSSLAPAAATGGTVRIGIRSAVSIGAIVKHGILIGDDCVLGANSYLNEHLPNNKVAYGTPAKQIRDRITGDSYLR